MTDLHEQIADLEAEIDSLSDAAERCRKSMIVAKVVSAGGVLLVTAILLGLIGLEPIVLVGGIAATLAGLGFYGSTKSTLEQVAGKIQIHEAHRSELIDRMELQTIHPR